MKQSKYMLVNNVAASYSFQREKYTELKLWQTKLPALKKITREEWCVTETLDIMTSINNKKNQKAVLDLWPMCVYDHRKTIIL